MLDVYITLTHARILVAGTRKPLWSIETLWERATQVEEETSYHGDQLGRNRTCAECIGFGR